MNMPPIGGEAIAAIVSMLLVLVLWTRVLLSKKADDAELDRKLVERQDRIDAEKARQSGPSAPPAETRERSGPWG